MRTSRAFPSYDLGYDLARCSVAMTLAVLYGYCAKSLPLVVILPAGFVTGIIFGILWYWGRR